MKRVILYLVLISVLFVIGYLAALDNSKPDILKRSKILLGTVVEIQVRDDNEEAADAINKAYAEISRIENLFSVYDSTGYIYKLNNQDTSLIIDPDINDVLIYSDSLWKISDGAFDASLLNLTDTWGFISNPAFPGDKKIKSALQNSGWDKVYYKNGKLKKGNVKLDFGAVAKGYAVDKAVDVLKKYGIKDALVNAGGEIKAAGGEWTIGVQDPDNEGRMISTIKLDGMSVATSGDYEQYFEFEGNRYHHLIDPETGYPGNKCRSVTVITKDNYFADGLATGIFIMGPEEGLILVEKLKDTEAMIIDSAGKMWTSSGFNKYIVR